MNTLNALGHILLAIGAILILGAFLIKRRIKMRDDQGDDFLEREVSKTEESFELPKGFIMGDIENAPSTLIKMGYILLIVGMILAFLI